MSESDDETIRRSDAIDELFTKWDIGGNCSIRFSELLQILQASHRVSNRDQQKWVKRLEAQVTQAKRQQPHASRGSFSLAQGGLLIFGDATGEPSLDPTAFQTLMKHLTAKDSPQEFDDFCKFCETAVKEAAQSTQGSKLRQDVWEMFRLLDANSNGYVELDELEALIGPQSKKQVIKWKHYLTAKSRQESVGASASPVEEPLTNMNSVDLANLDDEPVTLSLTLAEFQNFIHEYVERNDDMVPQLLEKVRGIAQQRNVQYVIDYNVHDIINEVMEDLLKEKPMDVLSGISKSVERLRRTGKYQKGGPLTRNRRASSAKGDHTIDEKK